MITTLYPIFQKWSAKGAVYIISDPHFNDSDCKYMNPDWPEAEEYLANINKIITKNDTLICLGDCGNLDYIRRIKAGYKVLIKGNHDDKGDSVYLRKKERFTYDRNTGAKFIREDLGEKFPYHSINIAVETDFHAPFVWMAATVDNKLFDEVYSGPLVISDKIILSHEPVCGLPYMLNIHGHVHNGLPYWFDEAGAHHMNLAADVVYWDTFNLGKAIQDGLLADITNIHRMTIDNAIAKKGK